MPQQFKSVYLPSYPADRSSQRHLKIAFGSANQHLYEAVKNRSSEELRRLLGVSDYPDLQRYATERHLSLNKACIVLIQEGIEQDNQEGSTEERFSNPLLATYRGGDAYLFHRWYPLLEAFSPRFVDAVLDEYAQGSKVVLDPFGGTGTVPLTAAQSGRQGLYCELNPVLQYVTDVKYSVSKLMQCDKDMLAAKLRETAVALRFNIGAYRPDAELLVAYDAAFQGSRLFDEETLEHVLQLRSYADTLNESWPILSRVFVTAVLASLVPASLMKRAGDLRYKTEDELRRREFPIFDTITQRLEDMAVDLEDSTEILGETVLLCEDARCLKMLPRLNVEAVVTSPPYLNGTNYVRNVKIELWFLRALRHQRDLAFWRLRAITGGINDVTKGKYVPNQSEDVLEVVKEVSRNAYDARIPMMIESYFADMQKVLQAMKQHLHQGATVAVDIGDSRYGGVHVPTDRLLAAIGDAEGYLQVDSQLLRVRKSRDSGLLSQRLLVFRYQPRQARRIGRALAPDTLQKWDSFKRNLPHQQQPFSKRNWGHPLHALCSYEGKMKPSLASFLTDAFVPNTGSVLDPFAGVGTIPFEACLQGKQAYAIELSPAAYRITKAKLQHSDSRRVKEILASLAAYLVDAEPSMVEIDSARRMNFNRSLDEYYHPKTFREILSARKYFQENDDDSPEHAYVMGCLLHLLHGNRPYALSRRSHSITPFAPTGPTEYRPLMDKLEAKVLRGFEAELPSGTTEGKVFFQDATTWWPSEVGDLDAVITSPPFFDSTRFYLGNWIRLWFCGWEREDFSSKPIHFVESRQKRSMDVYTAIFRQARERLKPGGVLVLHLGKSSKADMALELSRVSRTWFRTCDVFEESVSHIESHGVSDKGRVTGHQFLILN